MQRIHDATASPTLPAPPALTGPVGYFTGGTPGLVDPTIVRDWWLNMIQEELLALLTAAGITPDTTGANFTQVLQAIRGGVLPHGAQVFTASGNFTVPTGVTAIDVEVWGGGGGSMNSVGPPTNGASGGGYARKRITGLTPGQVIAVTVGSGGIATPNGTPGGNGGTTSFGAFCSATGGAGAVVGAVIGSNGGTGSGGDINVPGGYGGWPAAGVSGTLGGPGGCGGMGGGPASGGPSIGFVGIFPGGGAAGPCVSSGGGSPGGNGLCVVRW